MWLAVLGFMVIGLVSGLSLANHLACAHIWSDSRPYLVVRASLSQDGFQGTSLVVQWLRIYLPMQGTRVRALVREDPTCCGATKPVRQNY